MGVGLWVLAACAGRSTKSKGFQQTTWPGRAGQGRAGQGGAGQGGQGRPGRAGQGGQAGQGTAGQGRAYREALPSLTVLTGRSARSEPRAPTQIGSLRFRV